METWDPFHALCIHRRDAAEKLKTVESIPYTPPKHRGNRDWHWGRIRYLMEAPAGDPILLVRNKAGIWYVYDGNHRLCAAVLAGYETILASGDST